MSVDKNKVDGIFLIILSKKYVVFAGLDFRMAIIEAYSTTRKCGLASQDKVLWHEWSRTMLETLPPYPGESY